MGFFDTRDAVLTRFPWLMEAGYSFIGVLVGRFMVLRGIFFNRGDSLLTGAGLAVSLRCGWYTWRAYAAKYSGENEILLIPLKCQ